MTWIRWDTTAPRHELIGTIAERLRIPAAQAFGHFAAACCGFGEYRKDGCSGAVSDTTLEDWALWRGKPGRFAAVFRDLCIQRREDAQDPPGTVKGWWRQKALLEKQLRDAARRKPTDAPPETPDLPPENPRGFRAGSSGDVDGDVNELRTTTTTAGPRAMREGEPPVELNTPEARLIAQMGRQPDRWAVWDFLEHIPDPQQIPWVHRLAGYLQGLDFPVGICPTAEQLATACRDYAGDYSPAHFRGFVLRAIRGPRLLKSPAEQRAGSGQLDAATRWANGGNRA
jgi:hypothetical protein